MAARAPTTTERLLADGNVIVELGASLPLVAVQSFSAGDVSELGLRWLHRTIARLDAADRDTIQRHLLVPERIVASPRGRPRAWSLGGPPSGPYALLSNRRTGRGDSIRSGLALADQLSALYDALERAHISNVDINADRCLIVDGPGPGVIVAALGAATVVDGIPLLLDAPPAATADRFGLARLIDHLIPSGVRDHPTLRDLRALERCWRDHHLALPPALWRTAIDGAMNQLRVDRDAGLTIDLRNEPATLDLDVPIPRVTPYDTVAATRPAPPHHPEREPEASPARPPRADPSTEPEPIAGLVGLTPSDLTSHRTAEFVTLMILAATVLVLAGWTLARI